MLIFDGIETTIENLFIEETMSLIHLEIVFMHFLSIWIKLLRKNMPQTVRYLWGISMENIQAIETCAVSYTSKDRHFLLCNVKVLIIFNQKHTDIINKFSYFIIIIIIVTILIKLQ